MNSNTSSLTHVVAAALLVSAAPAFAQTPPIALSFDSPNGLGAAGVLYDQGWSLTLRADMPDALYHFTRVGGSDTRPFGDNEFIVLRDPDNCLDLRTFNGGRPYEDCGPFPVENETVLEVYVEEYDAPLRVDRILRTGAPPESVCNGSFAQNDPRKQVTRLSRIGPHAVGGDSPRPRTDNEGPDTGWSSADRQDCYGFGQDDDLPGLVIMADVGAARPYTTAFNRESARIRNLAAFLTNVTLELSGSRGMSVVATTIVRPRMLNPLVMIDAEVTRAPWIGFDFLQRVDGGPIQGRVFAKPRPSPGDISGITNAIANSLPIQRVLVRAVIVRGRAPDEIEDRNGDGLYTAADLELMGHTLLSNEALIAIRATPASRLDERATTAAGTGDDSDLACPVPTLMYNDLDGDGASGTACITGSSNSKVRVPR